MAKWKEGEALRRGRDLLGRSELGSMKEDGAGGGIKH